MFPKIAALSVIETTAQVAAFAHHDLLVTDTTGRAPSLATAVMAANPTGRFLLYYSAIQVSLTSPGPPPVFSNGLYVYPGWFLCLVGSTLSTTIGAGDTTLTVASATAFSTSQAILVDLESMLITNISGTTLTVTRGYYSTAAAHTAGALVRPHALGATANTWLMNLTANCPTDPSTC